MRVRELAEQSDYGRVKFRNSEHDPVGQSGHGTSNSNSVTCRTGLPNFRPVFAGADAHLTCT